MYYYYVIHTNIYELSNSCMLLVQVKYIMKFIHKCLHPSWTESAKNNRMLHYTDKVEIC